MPSTVTFEKVGAHSGTDAQSAVPKVTPATTAAELVRVEPQPVTAASAPPNPQGGAPSSSAAPPEHYDHVSLLVHRVLSGVRQRSRWE